MVAVASASSSAEQLLRVCADVSHHLIHAYENGEVINLNQLRTTSAKKYGYKGVPKLTDVIAAVPDNYKKQLLPMLKAKPIRSASGIAVVAVMCKPHRCPHIALTGNVCVSVLLHGSGWIGVGMLTSHFELDRYCPGGPDSDFEYSTQSYTGYEPTSMRAIRARYDPFEQSTGRVKQLRELGHEVDKVEYIVMGGTFMSLAEEYRNTFIAQLHNALSGFTGTDVDEAVK